MSDSEPAGTSKGKTKTAAPKTIFVISPIGSTGTAEHRRYRNTLEYIVKKAFHAPDYAVVRADEETSPDSITTQVIGRIVESDLIIADLTDHNPNVFYELAVAHGYQKPVIHMMQSGQKVPFDVVDQRVIFYDLTDPESVDKARGGLIASAEWLEANSGQTRNPLSAYGQFSAISSASGGGEAGDAVALALESLSRQVARLESRILRRGDVKSAILFDGSGRRRDYTPEQVFNTMSALEAELVGLQANGEPIEETEAKASSLISQIKALRASFPDMFA